MSAGQCPRRPALHNGQTAWAGRIFWAGYQRYVRTGRGRAAEPLPPVTVRDGNPCTSPSTISRKPTALEPGASPNAFQGAKGIPLPPRSSRTAAAERVPGSRTERHACRCSSLGAVQRRPQRADVLFPVTQVHFLSRTRFTLYLVVSPPALSGLHMLNQRRIRRGLDRDGLLRPAGRTASPGGGTCAG